MGMWQGIYLGMQNIQQQRERSQERDDRLAAREEDLSFRREEMEMRRQAFQAQQEQNRIAAIRDALPGVRAASERAAALADRGARLRGYFPDNEIVDRIISTGNVDAIDRVLGNIESRYEEAESQREGGGQEFLTQWLSMAESDYTFTPASAIDYDLTPLNVTEEEFAAMGFDTSFTVPGQIVGRPSVERPRADFEDYSRAEERIATAAVERGNLEMQRIAAGLAQISENLEGSLDPATETTLREAQQALVDRRMQIEGALDMASGDNASYSGILSLYGNESATAILEGSTVQLDPEMLSPAFTENMGGTPMPVTSPTQSQLLTQVGVLQPGSPVIFNGQAAVVGSDGTPMLSFTSEAEIMRLFESGVLQSGDTVLLNGQPAIV